MAEAESSGYNIDRSNPISLKKIAAIEVAFQLWRRANDVIRCCENATSDEIELDKKVVLEDAVSALPSEERELIQKYVIINESSLSDWFDVHIYSIFEDYDRRRPYDILRSFHNFSHDWDGSIHYVRTAARMMVCEEFNDEEKFRIACKYGFENGIRRFWPSVSAEIKCNVEFHRKSPHLLHWISRMKGTRIQ